MKGGLSFCAGGILGGVVVLLASVPLHAAGLRDARDAARARWRLVPVIVPTMDLDPAERLSVENLSMREVPAFFASSEVFKVGEAAALMSRSMRRKGEAGVCLRKADVTPVDRACAERVERAAKGLGEAATSEVWEVVGATRQLAAAAPP